MENKIDYFEYVDNFSTYSNIKSIMLYGNTKKDYKVTIAIPTYKRVELLKESLESALNQENFEDYEIIIIDNDDNFKNNECLELVKRFNSSKVKYYKNEKNIGMFGNWNRCIELSNGEYITILNDDDWLEKNYLLEMMSNIGKSNGILCNYCKRDLRNNKEFSHVNLKKSKIIKLKKERFLDIKDLYFGNVIPGSLGGVFKKENLVELGGYNPAYFPTSDYILTSNFVYRFKTLKLNKELTNYRIQENESLKKEVVQKFIENDFIFREFLIREKIVPKFYRRFLNIIKNNQISYYLNYWEINSSILEAKVSTFDKILNYFYLKKRKIQRAIKIGITIKF